MASPIQVGATIPNVSLTVWDKAVGEPKQVSTHEVFKGKRAILSAIPAAFSPGCTRTHCPSYVRGIILITHLLRMRLGSIDIEATVDAKLLRERGFDLIAMTAVNDIWTLVRSLTIL